jgi:hypothetical protein
MKFFKPFSISGRLLDHLIQAVFIFSSVILAFWLSEFQTERKNQNSLETSMAQIAAEMSYNHNRIESVFAYHLYLTNKIDSLKQLEGLNIEKMHAYNIDGWQGVQMPLLRSTAYQTFLNSGMIEHAPLELVKALADIYITQSVIERLDNSFFDLAISEINLTTLDRINHLSNLYVEILPDVIGIYQKYGREWLGDKGYDQPILDTDLLMLIKRRNSK